MPAGRAQLPQRGAKITVSQSIILYRKFKPHSIFTGSNMLSGGEVLIVAEDGTIEAIVPATDGGDNVQELTGILCPGMINAHCHIELSHMKGIIPEHTGLVEFVKQVITKRESGPAGDEKDPEQYEQFIRQKIQAMSVAADELWQSGTVAVGDICNTADSLELKKQSPLRWHNFIEVSGFVDALAARRLSVAEAVLDTFAHPGNIAAGRSNLTAHAPYSVSKTLFGLLNEHTRGQIVSVHNQESAAEDELFLSKSGGFLELFRSLNIPAESFSATGRTSLQSWLPYFNGAQKIIAVHNTFTAEEDLKQAAGSGQSISYCLCINANLYIENALPPVQMLLHNNSHIVIGTDSYASNHRLNMMAEINSLRKHFPKLPLETVLQWATINGAEALGISDVYGSFEKGKKPGLALINEANGTCERVSV
ncbi:MAG: amidohydrolase [Chitinophagaceae bacterium]|nr:MAG: amidohydrolase [Chitinophagaceae bacterium]